MRLERPKSKRHCFPHPGSPITWAQRFAIDSKSLTIQEYFFSRGRLVEVSPQLLYIAIAVSGRSVAGVYGTVVRTGELRVRQVVTLGGAKLE
jgi:hypothetical protein